MLNNDNSLRMSFKGTLAPFCPFLWLLGCLFCHDCRLLVFKNTVELKRMGGVGIQQVRMPQSLLFLPRFSHFSLINVLQIISVLWLISRILKTLILKNMFFYQFFHCFYGGDDFQRSLFYHFCWHHPTFCTKVKHINTDPLFLIVIQKFWWRSP